MPKKKRKKGVDPFIPDEDGRSYSYRHSRGRNAPRPGNAGYNRYLRDEDSMGRGSPSYSYPTGAGRNAPKSRNAGYDGYLPDEDSKGPGYDYDGYKGEARYPEKNPGYLKNKPPITGTQRMPFSGIENQGGKMSASGLVGPPVFKDYGRQETGKRHSIEYVGHPPRTGDDRYLDPATAEPEEEKQIVPTLPFHEKIVNRTQPIESVTMILPWGGVPAKQVASDPFSTIGSGPIMDWGADRISELVLDRLGLPLPGRQEAVRRPPAAKLLEALVEMGVTR